MNEQSSHEESHTVPSKTSLPKADLRITQPSVAGSQPRTTLVWSWPKDPAMSPSQKTASAVPQLSQGVSPPPVQATVAPVPSMPSSLQGHRVGVALCGAELAGTAHAGVLQALDRIGVRPDAVAGSSAGALVASLYAHGYSVAEFRRIATRFPGVFLLDYGFPLVSSLANVVSHPWRGRRVGTPRGLFRGRKLRRYIEKMHQQRVPKLPFYIVATDLYTTNRVVFTNDKAAVSEGYAEEITNLSEELTGSCAIPGMFTPVRHRKWMLVDGGVRDLVPVTILRRAGCTKILAVDVHRLAGDWYPITVIDVLQRSLDTLMDESMEASDLAGHDVYVIRPRLRPTSWLWWGRDAMSRNIDLAFRHTLRHEAEILEFLGRA